MKRNINIVKSMGIYTISNVLNAAIPFLLLPVLTRYLDPSDYGVLSNFNAIANFMVPLVGINLMASVQVQYIKEEVDNQSYMSTGLRLALTLTLLFSIALLFLGGTLEEFIKVPKFFLYFIALYALFNVIIEVLLAIWRMEDAAINYGIFRIVRTLIELSFVLFFVIGLEMNFEGSIYGMMAAYGLGSVVALVLLMRKNLLFGSFSMDFLRHAVKFGVPLIPHTLSGVIIMYSDKLIITYYHGQADNGIYTVGFMIGQAIGLLQNSFNQAWVPWAFQKLKGGSENDKSRMVKITYYYLIGILLLVFFLWLMLPIIYTYFIGDRFSEGMQLVLWIALGFAFNGMYKMVSVYIYYLEKTFIIAMTSFGVAIVNVILNFMFIPKYGLQGAAVATMIAMGLQFIVTWGVSSRLIDMPWFWKRK